ncbi:hypothetical protein AGOR_G00199080 [Albula goreensis]|uniref:Uncharacterized protein n=1 Tax=Albula goreensis TaxID=1534307 RepID=A0A8T3CQT8_9TELE|nr:hypothetical protein AGOR_G00199080 [Albula goreensis]
MEMLLAVGSFLMCFQFLIAAQPSISVRDPIYVALPGETLQLQFDVTVPINQSMEIVCYHAGSERKLFSIDVSETKTTHHQKLPVFNSSYSGEYYCKYQDVSAYWVVLVRDEGYREPDSRIDDWDLTLIVMIFGLFLFSGIGSAILLKDYRNQLNLKDKRKDEEEEDSEDGEMMNEAATDSLYTVILSLPIGHPLFSTPVLHMHLVKGAQAAQDLQHGTSSIYNVIDPSTKNNNSQQKQVKTQGQQKEDGIFESVYENF